MKLALYKGKGKLFDKLVRWWTSSPYSHCELVCSLEVDDGESSLCMSSSFRDGGVRTKVIKLNPDYWDIIEAEWINEDSAIDWFMLHSGEAYDVIGLLGFVIPFRDVSDKWFCSEACAEASGFEDSFAFNPGMMGRIFKRIEANIKGIV